jgi:hypothetical protein
MLLPRFDSYRDPHKFRVAPSGIISEKVQSLPNRINLECLNTQFGLEDVLAHRKSAALPRRCPKLALQFAKKPMHIVTAVLQAPSENNTIERASSESLTDSETVKLPNVSDEDSIHVELLIGVYDLGLAGARVDKKALHGPGTFAYV